MAVKRGDNQTLDLLKWSPPEITERFAEDDLVRAHLLSHRISRAVAVTLKESDLAREDIAERMGEFLGETVPKNMLDAYSSESRESHNISLERAIALAHATDDIRVFGDLLSRLGYAVIPQQYLGAVDEAMWAEQEERAKTNRLASRRRWKGGL